MTPEAKARLNIDAFLQQAGGDVCDMAQADIYATHGVAVREFPLNTSYGFADCVPVPPISEQYRIVAEVDANLRRALVLRRSTPAKAFSG